MFKSICSSLGCGALAVCLLAISGCGGGSSQPQNQTTQPPPEYSGPLQRWVIDWQAPMCNQVNCAEGGTELVHFQNLTKYILPQISGVGFSVPWSSLDDCSTRAPYTQAPCNGEPNYDWAIIDNTLLSYINATVGTGSNTFSNGCLGGNSCVIMLVLDPEQDKAAGDTYTPPYVMSTAYATALGSAPQDVVFCSIWPGAVYPPWTGAVPCTGTYTGLNACVANVSGACSTYGTGLTCGTPASDNLSGFPVVYETPIMTAYQAWIRAVFQHYSSGGTSPGPSIAPYIKYIRIGLATGGEDSPGCAMSDDGSITFWPGRKGLALEPQGFTQAGYLTSWANGDGDGYVTAMYKFFAGLDTHGIVIDTSSHAGPPANNNYAYANTEAQLAQQYGIGFGTESAIVSDIAESKSGSACYGATPNPNGIGCSTNNWVSNFKAYSSVFHRVEMRSTPWGTAYDITSITVAGNVATVQCSDNDGPSQDACGTNYGMTGYTLWVAGNSNSALNGPQTLIACPTCTASQVAFNTGATSGGNGGTLYEPSYWPELFPFISQQDDVNSVEISGCEADYAWGNELGFTTSKCTGNAGPDSSYQDAASQVQTSQ